MGANKQGENYSLTCQNHYPILATNYKMKKMSPKDIIFVSILT